LLLFLSRVFLSFALLLLTNKVAIASVYIESRWLSSCVFSD
jgi:hypothetical protein